MRSALIRTLEAIVSLKQHKKIVHENKSNQKYLLLPLFGMIGDGVLFLDALSEYFSFFHDKQGYKIVIACRSQMGKLIRMVYPDEKYEIVEMNRNKMQKSLKEFMQCLNRLGQYDFDMIINVRERLSDENILLYALPAKYKITFRNGNIEPSNFIAKFFYRNTYDRVVYADPDSDQYKRYGKMLKELGANDYISHISRIPELYEGGKVCDSYVIVSPGASDEIKCWPSDRFAKICDWIIEKYNINVYIVGAQGDKKYADIIKKNIKNIRRTFDYCGNTSISEWIEILRNAKLVISNDSASIHIAAAVQTPAVCIAPQHDGYRFLPYEPDEILIDDVLPYPVRCEKVNCFDCRLNNRKREIYADPDCKKIIKEKRTMKCIDKISIADVMKAIDVVMGSNYKESTGEE